MPWKARQDAATTHQKFLPFVRELARFREDYAQRRDIPAAGSTRMTALVELASTKPRNMQELGRFALLADASSSEWR